jgi:cellulose synthase/poly-beta-1,6-N-acetylglucosamine synthase-like glycosyltransferase
MDDPVRPIGRGARDRSLRRRAARLGWLTAGLVVLTLGSLALAAWLTTGDSGSGPGTVDLPVNLTHSPARFSVVLAAASLVAATLCGMAALQTATAMQVLNRDRRIPPPLSPHLQSAVRSTLGPAALRALDIENPPEWAAISIPDGDELPPGTRLRCTVLVPAHDEEAVLAATLDSLAGQSRRPDRVLVIADNCTDATVQVARANGVEVVETVGNTEKKAGALNQQLALLLPGLAPHDVVMVMDADSTVSPEFLDKALGLLEDDADLMAVGGLFYGEDGGGLVGQLQRNEYGRYQRVVARRLNRVFVLTGTAAVVRGYALRAVAQARGSLIPGPPGKVYDTLAMTEDNELTLALKSLGAKMTCPPECRVTTEVMTSWRDLWRQRMRWQRGALENVSAYGLTRTTALYWAQQLSLFYGVVALWSYLLLLAISLLATDSINWSPFWMTIAVVFLAERLVTVWSVGWRGRVLAAPILIELAYACFLQVCFVTSIIQMATGRKAGWNYVPRPANPVAPPALGAYVVIYGIVLPTSVLFTDWYQALSLWVAFNTLVFVVLSLLQLLPPLRRDARRGWASNRARRT